MTTYRKLAAVLFAGSLVLAVCGDDDDDDTTATTAAASTEAPATEAPSTEAPSTEAPATEAPSTEAPSAEASSSAEATADSGMAAAQAKVKQYQDSENQPIGVTIPLAGKPEKKTIAWLECELESCPYITQG